MRRALSAAYDFETMSIQAGQGTPITGEQALAGRRVAVIQARSRGQLADHEGPRRAGLVVVRSFTTDVPHGFAVKKGDPQLLGKLNDGLSQVIKDGTWPKLHRQFLPTAPVPAGFGS